LSAPVQEPLSAVDHTWLRMDDPTNLMVINGVLVLESPVPIERIRAILEQRLQPIPRFHQRIVTRGGKSFWETDPEFDMDAHLHRMVLPAPGGDEALREVISELSSQPFDRRRPLWHFHLIEGYKGGAVLMARLHHCIGDGMVLLLVLLSLTDQTAEADGDLGNPFTDLFRRPPVRIERAMELAEQIMPEGIRLMRQSAEAFRSMGRVVTGAAGASAFGRLVLRRNDPKTLFKGPLGVAKRLAWSEMIPLEEVKEVGRALGGTINDVLLSAMTGALRRYLDRRGERAHGLNFRAAMPVNLRPLDEMADLGNQFGLIFLSLPVGIDDPVERLRELGRRATALKRSAEPIVVLGILKMMGLSPNAVQKLVVKIFAAKTTAVATNVPGPREVLYLAGRKIEEIFFWVPQSGRVGLGISIFSYAGHVRLGIGTDAGLVPDPEVIAEGFHEELEELKRRAG